MPGKTRESQEPSKPLSLYADLTVLFRAPTEGFKKTLHYAVLKPASEAAILLSDSPLPIFICGKSKLFGQPRLWAHAASKRSVPFVCEKGITAWQSASAYRSQAFFLPGTEADAFLSSI
ncbi:hypothetical protein [Saccharibacillus deserti]|uniref:hypothetical protein n=1 Tax=Saccharibacillus deserti TaxID=1634444 RepID=UPI0015560C6F|nr:hypothetical protein [Saccharibacillus deserti]